MANSNGPIIDMTRDGGFIERPKPTLGKILLRLAAFGVFLCIAAVIFWTAVLLLPLLLLLGIIGYFGVRAQLRRSGLTTFTFRH